MSPAIAKLVAAAIAVAALIGSAYVADPTVQHLLVGLASVLVGKEYLPRVGDTARQTHPDDLGEK